MPLETDPCIYQCGSKTDGTYVAIATVVDDLLVISSNASAADAVLTKLNLKLKRLAWADRYLGMGTRRDETSNKIFLNHSAFQNACKKLSLEKFTSDIRELFF